MQASEPVTGQIAVASRRQALQTFKNNIGGDRRALALLTGESGSGKTWLWQQLTTQLSPAWRWHSLDISEGMDAVDFLNLVGQGLDIPWADRLGAARVSLAKALADEAADGRPWLLVIENAERCSEAVWNEIQALAHAMEKSTGFAAMILAGPADLARKLATRPMAPLATRIAAHVHLLPFDRDEAREMIAARVGAEGAAPANVDALHRDARGNPRLLLQLLRKHVAENYAPQTAVQSSVVRRLPGTDPRPSAPTVNGEPKSPAMSDEEEQTPSQVRPSDLIAELSSPPLVPDRPPLRIEEGLVEVGWDGNLEAESAVESEEPIADPTPALAEPADAEPVDAEPLGEEMIEDHYAALQAWTEWAKNRGQTSSPGVFPTGRSSATMPTVQPGSQSDGEEAADPGTFVVSGLRAESEHEHAPYSQLFTRLRQAK
ncbi:MAG: AAA family ATPase [Planctomycetaceae bacterium]|nr:AAA family ATPase [Planctomycetaceae bacterium]